MKATLKYEEGMRFSGINEDGLVTYFDTKPKSGGNGSAPTPMELMLQCLAGCTAMDVVSMLRKRCKAIEEFNMYLEAERATEHPRVLTKVNIVYELKSPDATIEEFNTIIGLSQDKYCGISAMFRRSGCEVNRESRLI